MDIILNICLQIIYYLHQFDILEELIMNDSNNQRKLDLELDHKI